MSKTKKNKPKRKKETRCERKYCQYAFKSKKETLRKSIQKKASILSTPEERKFTNDLKEAWKKELTKLGTKKGKKELFDNCKRVYCNPGCKDTMFEDGPGTAQRKNRAIWKAIQETRKDMFQGNTSVLRDNFYEDLPAKDVQRLKKKGAVSGCTILALYT